MKSHTLASSVGKLPMLGLGDSMVGRVGTGMVQVPPHTGQVN
jgi:hypothetical protein